MLGAAVSSRPRQAGQIVAGRYRLDHRLSAGGMGEVFRAEDPDGRAVAVKLISLDTTSTTARSRFQREARLAASFDHPHIVRVHDYGRGTEGDERFYLVMDLVDGPTLRSWFSRRDVVPVGLGVALIRQLLSALSYLHARDVIHRDLKPANLLVERRPDGGLSLALVDFGIAAELDDPQRLTREGQALGTPSYMAPEQGRGEPIGPAADLYAVGVLLYECLSGSPPFKGTTPEVLYGKMTRPAPALPDDCAPEPLRALVAELLEREPERRPRAAEVVRRRLEPFATTTTLDDDTWDQLVEPGPKLPVTAMDLRPARAALDLWGRERERAQLDAAALVAEGGEARIVVLRGDVGMGKSALLRELELSLREQGRFEAIRSESSARGLLRGLRRGIERALRTVDESRATLLRAIRALLRRSIDGEEDDEEVQALLDFLRPRGVEGEPQAREAAFAVITRLLRRMTRLQPLLVVLEDVHAATDDVNAWLDHLLFELRIEDMPLLVVVTKRLRLGVEHTTGLQLPPSSRLLRFELGPLEPKVVDDGLHRSYGLAPELRRRVVNLAGGNPSFARMLASIEHLPPQHTSSVGSETLPHPLYDTLSQLLRERLSLHERSDSMRQLMLCLAVLGGRADEALLSALTIDDDADLDAFEDDLDRLIGLHLLAEDPHDQLTFVHPLMRDLLLADGQPRRVRRLHRQAAALRMEAGDQEAGMVGEHLLAVGREDEAVEWWLRAQRYSFFTGEIRQAEQWGRRAIAHLPKETPERADAQLLLSRILRETLQYEAAIDLLQPLLTTAPDDERRMLAAELLGEVRQEMSDEEGWRRSIAFIERHLPPSRGRGRRAGLRALAFWFNHLLDVDRAETHATEALDGADPFLDEWVPAQKRRFWALFYQVELKTAAVVASEMVARGQRDKRADVEAEGHRFMGKIHQLTPSPKESIAAYERALTLQRRLGRQSRVTNLYLDIMFVACTAEQFETTQHYLDLFHRVRPDQPLDFTGVLVRLTELRCRARRDGVSVTEPLGALHDRVKNTQWGFRAVIEGEWLWAQVRDGDAEALHDQLEAHIAAAGELPPLVWYAKLLEYLGEDLRRSSEVLARAAFVQAADVYRRLHNDALAERVLERAGAS